jgi:hypothetical protein
MISKSIFKIFKNSPPVSNAFPLDKKIPLEEVIPLAVKRVFVIEIISSPL